MLQNRFGRASACVLLIALSGCAGAGQRSEAPSQSEPATVATAGPGATLVVQGLSCPLCATNVDKQLESIAGVSGVRVNLQTGEIEVDFAEGARPSDAALTQAVVDGGFTLVRIVPRS